MSQTTSQKSQTEEQKKQKEDSIELTIKKWLLKFINIKSCSKTIQCKHNDGCILNIIIKTLKGLFLGFCAKSALNLVGVLLNFKKLLKNPLNIFNVFKDSLRFGCFPGVFNLVMQSTLCFLRRQGFSEKVQYFWSGFAAGLISLATRQKDNRSVWGIFLLARGIECFYNSMVNRGIIKKRPLDYTILFATLMTFIGGICYAYEPLCLPSGLNKFYRLVCSETKEDLDFRRCWIDIRNNELAPFGFEKQNPLEAMLLLKKKRH